MIIKVTVRKLLIGLNEFKSAVFDELHHRVLKKLAEAISEPLVVLFTKLWEMWQTSGNWKGANIVPIFKNYRSVSLTSIHRKLLEQIVKSV